MDWKELALSCIYTPMMVLQLVLFFFFYQNYLGFDLLMYIGSFLWVLSAMFGLLPIYEIRKKGGVPKGSSYMHTTELVDTGLYSIVRHPQYLAGLLIILALMLMTQHWLSVTAGVLAFVAFYIDILIVDPRLVEKFGEEYREYMNRVPGLNFILGIVRRLRQRARGEEEQHRGLRRDG
jgi:protein-S-isoprenylcysteine O-methyltransferase Ste14